MDRWRAAGWLAASGMVALAYEVVWLRRLALWLGGTSVASAVTLAAFMAGLALGSALADSMPRSVTRSAPLAYAGFEAVAAGWAVVFPGLLWLAQSSTLGAPDFVTFSCAFGLLLVPAMALGATWPIVTRAIDADAGALLYAVNTTGAVCGVLLTTFVLLPAVGVRTTELLAASGGLVVAAWAALSPPASGVPSAAPPTQVSDKPLALPWPMLTGAVAVAGLASLGLEVVWFRLAATALGASVQANGWVLAVFLATMAGGAAVGRSYPRNPATGVGWGLIGLGALAVVGAFAWGQAPFVVAWLWQVGGAEHMLTGSAVVSAIVMAGAPAASGLAFSCAVRCLADQAATHAGRLYAANTAGGIIGALAGGLWAIPTLELHGSLLLFAGAAVAMGAWVNRTLWPLLLAAALAMALPRWDERLYAVGVHVRISDFAEPTRAAVDRFARRGWDLVSYDHGMTAAVAVGRSRKTGNLWMSINGNVDASTGDDMPTQVLSAELPLRLAEGAQDVLLVGLASGITAGTALRDPRLRSLTVAEIEPAVVRASRFFDHASGAPLDDPRTRLVVNDARAMLARSPAEYDVIISEPSNPWISGVSSLFTLEYWQLVRSRLKPGGVVCQWLQLYGMGPREVQGLLRTFLHVFPDAQLVQTIEGSDVLLIGGLQPLPRATDAYPTLSARELTRIAGIGWLNTDDQPRVEWAAPRWLHYDSRPANAELLWGEP